MENKFTKITNNNEWQDLLNKVLFKTFFHSWEWEDFLEKQFKWLKFERYVYDNSALLSLARVGNKLISHPFCEYGGPLPLVEKVDGRTFQKDLFDEFSQPFKISFHPKLLNYFEGIDFQENQRETYFYENLDLKTEENVWQSMDRNRHRAIKEAQSHGFELEKCRNQNDSKKLYDFYVGNLKKHKTLSYPFAFFQFFLQSHQAEILLAKKGSELVGGNIFLFYDRIIHSFLCGFDRKYKNSGVHSLLLWSEIEVAREKGLQIFDFGATRKDSSVRDFKERWGAESRPIYELKNYSGESCLRKSKLRDAYALLPAFLIKKISPYLLKYKL